MQKLALVAGDPEVQSFDATPAIAELRRTVRGYVVEDNGGDGGGHHTDLCSAISCATCDAARDVWEQRRIILLRQLTAGSRRAISVTSPARENAHEQARAERR